jgi:hypothetical protein
MDELYGCFKRTQRHRQHHGELLARLRWARLCGRQVASFYGAGSGWPAIGLGWGLGYGASAYRTCGYRWVCGYP